MWLHSTHLGCTLGGRVVATQMFVTNKNGRNGWAELTKDVPDWMLSESVARIFIHRIGYSAHTRTDAIPPAILQARLYTSSTVLFLSRGWSLQHLVLSGPSRVSSSSTVAVAASFCPSRTKYCKSQKFSWHTVPNKASVLPPSDAFGFCFGPASGDGWKELQQRTARRAQWQRRGEADRSQANWRWDCNESGGTWVWTHYCVEVNFHLSKYRWWMYLGNYIGTYARSLTNDIERSAKRTKGLW